MDEFNTEEMVTAKRFLQEFARDLKEHKRNEAKIVNGWAVHLEAREYLIAEDEIIKAIATYESDPGLFLETAQARLYEVRRLKP